MDNTDELNCPAGCVRLACPEPDWLEKHGALMLTILGIVGSGLGVGLAYCLKSRCTAISCGWFKLQRDPVHLDTSMTAASPVTPPPSPPDVEVPSAPVRPNFWCTREHAGSGLHKPVPFTPSKGLDCGETRPVEGRREQWQTTLKSLATLSAEKVLKDRMDMAADEHYRRALPKHLPWPPFDKAPLNGDPEIVSGSLITAVDNVRPVQPCDQLVCNEKLPSFPSDEKDADGVHITYDETMKSTRALRSYIRQLTGAYIDEQKSRQEQKEISDILRRSLDALAKKHRALETSYNEVAVREAMLFSSLYRTISLPSVRVEMASNGLIPYDGVDEEEDVVSYDVMATKIYRSVMDQSDQLL